MSSAKGVSSDEKAAFVVNNRVINRKKVQDKKVEAKGNAEVVNKNNDSKQDIKDVKQVSETKSEIQAPTEKLIWTDLKKLRERGKTFDVLLFHSRDRFVAQLIRGLTWSNWDHAMVFYRDPVTGRLFLLEAAQSSVRSGINLIPFSRFEDVFYLYKEKYSRIVYREFVLPCGRTVAINKKMDEFVTKVQGSSYGISSLFNFFGFSEEVTSTRTFFCSELIAASYRYCGLLATHVCTASIYPSHFGKEYTLPLLKKAYLGEQEDVFEYNPMSGVLPPPPSNVYVEQDHGMDEHYNTGDESASQHSHVRSVSRVFEPLSDGEVDELHVGNSLNERYRQSMMLDPKDILASPVSRIGSQVVSPSRRVSQSPPTSKAPDPPCKTSKIKNPLEGPRDRSVSMKKGGSVPPSSKKKDVEEGKQYTIESKKKAEKDK